MEVIMELVLLVVVLALLLVALMIPGSNSRTETTQSADDFEDYLAWRMARRAEQRRVEENGGCFGLLALAVVIAALLAPLLTSML
jgi:hypothetical protein